MKSSTIVDGIKVPTEVEEFSDISTIEVEVGTTGYKGGDTGQGGRTYFRIKDLCDTDMRCDFEPIGTGNHVGEVTIIFGGDSELNTFMDGLRFAADSLEGQVNGKMSVEPRFTHEETALMLQIIQSQLCVQFPNEIRNGILKRIKSKLEKRYEE